MQSATRILLVRHGQTDWNADTRIQGHTDIALNATGRWQAQQLALALAEETLDAVYASDLSRAHATALPAAQSHGLKVQVEPGLRERGFGEFEGRTFSEIETGSPEDALRWRRRDPDFGPPGGEVLQAFHERSVSVVRTLAQRHEGQCILVVTHGGVLDCLYRAATGQGLQAPRTWEIANAAINRLLHTPQGLTLVGWADASHLSAP